LKQLQQRLHVTVLFVTHDQLEALSLSDTIAVMNDGRVEQVAAPRALYEAPASTFVRDFVGQNLILPARVRSVLGNSRARVSIEGLPESTTFLGRFAFDWSPQPGEPVTLAVRPEDVEFIPPGPLHVLDEGKALVGRIRSAVFLGDRYQLSLALVNGVHLQLQAPRAQTDWEPDQQVGLYLPAEAVTLWPS
jgi:ABC-type Fe3+/spermidine/putrescine transport system ATPase subunit